MSKANEPVVMIAAVEGGGTSFRIAICQVHPAAGSLAPTILYRTEIDSSHDRPAETLAACVAFLQQHKPAVTGYHALGIATFGPVGVRPEETNKYGRILESTPKAPWRNVDLLTPLQEACQGSIPLAVRVETDVNAPALAEYLQAKKTDPDLTSTAYITVGTGVGVGLVVNGLPVHGRMHPEGGHVPVQPLEGDTFVGYSWGDKCPFHGKNTVEGLASSVALTERLQALQTTDAQLSRHVLSTLPDDHDIWKHAVNALANLCVTLLLTVSVEKIVIGGGIMNRTGLLEQIQAKTLQLVNGYIPMPELNNMSSLITTSKAGSDAGLVGAIVLAEHALTRNNGDDAEQREIRMKQTAFEYGLVHGILVGAVSSALVCKYLWRSSR